MLPQRTEEEQTPPWRWASRSWFHHGVNSRRDLQGVSYPPDFSIGIVLAAISLWTDFVRRASFVNDHGRLDAHVLMYCPLESVYALVGGGYFDPRQTGKDIWAEADQMNIPRIREIEEIEGLIRRRYRICTMNVSTR